MPCKEVTARDLGGHKADLVVGTGCSPESPRLPWLWEQSKLQLSKHLPKAFRCIRQHPRIKQLFQLSCHHHWFEELLTAPPPSLRFPKLLVLRLNPVCAEEVAVRR